MAKPGRRPVAAIERVLSRATLEGDCWVWQGATTWDGYGEVGVGSRTDGTRGVKRPHRIVYEAERGSIPEGLELDHLCRVKVCVNPDHMEPVTRAENARRAEAAAPRPRKQGRFI